MANFILVHGACHGAWCWRDVIPGLTARGHRVQALDMPGRGAPGPDAGDLTLADQARTITDACDEPAILVGHSAGGFSISAAADLAPDQVDRLVYVAALLPRDGHSLVQMMGALKGKSTPARFIRTENKLGYIFDTTDAAPLLYNGADDEVAQWALTQICAEPSAPHRTPITLGGGFAKTPKSYIRCTQDRVIPAVDQTEMAAGLQDKDIFDMTTGHSPFLSDPDRLVEILDTIAGGN